jgi:hypothetical protein
MDDGRVKISLKDFLSARRMTELVIVKHVLQKLSNTGTTYRLYQYIRSTHHTVHCFRP